MVVSPHFYVLKIQRTFLLSLLFKINCVFHYLGCTTMHLSLFALFAIAALFLFGKSQADVSTVEIDLSFDAQTVQKLQNADQSVILVREGATEGWYSVWATFVPTIYISITWNSSLQLGTIDSILSPGNTILLGPVVTDVRPGNLYDCAYSECNVTEVDPSWVADNQVGIQLTSTGETRMYCLLQGVYSNVKQLQYNVILFDELLPSEHAIFTVDAPLLMFVGPSSIEAGTMIKQLNSIATSPITEIDWVSQVSISASYVASSGLFECDQCNPL